MLDSIIMGIRLRHLCQCMKYTENKGNAGGSHLSHTAVKLDSHLARIFPNPFPCII